MKLALLRKKGNHSTSSGFTVIELMVTITIVVLVTGIILLQYSSFNSSVLLTSQAYLTAFDIREAQSLAVSVRGHSSEFYEQYGLYFDMSNPYRYILFQDNNHNNSGDEDISPARYNSASDGDIEEQVGNPYVIDPRFRIIDICRTAGTVTSCYSNDASFNKLAISFKRPDFNAAFYAPGVSNIKSVQIKFGSEGGSLTKSVTVYTTGQIKID